MWNAALDDCRTRSNRERSRARELARFEHAELISAVPRRDDPTLSTRQVDALRRNATEIEREADAYQMRFSPVTAVAAALERVVKIA